MSVELQWYDNNDVALDENLNPLNMVAGSSYTIKLKNIGDTTATNIGLYIKTSTVYIDANNNGIVYPSSHGAQIDLHDILAWGAAGGGMGYSITQHGVPEVAVEGYGDGADNPISLSKSNPLADGDDELDPDEETTMVVSLNVPPATPAQRKFVALEVTYTEGT